MKFDPKYLLEHERDYLNTILYKISIVTNIPQKIIINKRRKREITIARHLYFYIVDKERKFELSLGRIGSLLNKDHTSVSHGIKKIKNDIDVNYIPTMLILEKYNTLTNTSLQYKLKWKDINLIDLLKNNKKIELDIIEEEYKLKNI